MCPGRSPTVGVSGTRDVTGLRTTPVSVPMSLRSPGHTGVLVGVRRHQYRHEWKTKEKVPGFGDSKWEMWKTLPGTVRDSDGSLDRDGVPTPCGRLSAPNPLVLPRFRARRPHPPPGPGPSRVDPETRVTSVSLPGREYPGVRNGGRTGPCGWPSVTVDSGRCRPTGCRPFTQGSERTGRGAPTTGGAGG